MTKQEQLKAKRFRPRGCLTNKPAVKALPARLTYSGHNFHDVRIPADAGHWRKIFLRGVQVPVLSNTISTFLHIFLRFSYINM
jgi:hypothetical protein